MRVECRASPEAEHTVWWLLLARAIEQRARAAIEADRAGRALPGSARDAMRMALRALREARNDIDSAICENLPNERYASYQRIIAAYREQLADHDAAIDALRAALGGE